MAVCGDKVCEAKTTCCESLMPSMCGGHQPYYPSGSCEFIRFTGVEDITIKQGQAFDPAEGVHAYDGKGDGIEFTYTPSEFDSCTVGQVAVIYKAVGIGDGLLPSLCLNEPMLYTPYCGNATGTAKRIVTIEPYAAVCESYVCCASVMCDKPDPEPEPEPPKASVKIQVDASRIEEFDSSDYEIIVDWSYENTGEVTLTEHSLESVWGIRSSSQNPLEPGEALGSTDHHILDPEDYERGYITYWIRIEAKDADGNIVSDRVTENLPVATPNAQQ